MAPAIRKRNGRRSSGKRKKSAKAEASKPAPEKRPKAEVDEAADLSSDAENASAPGEIVKKKDIPPRAPPAGSKSAPPQRKQRKSKSGDAEKESKTRTPRRKVTMETHLEKYDGLLELLDEHIDRLRKNKEPGSRVFTTIRKAVRELHKEAPKIANSRRKSVADNQNKVSGFVLQCRLSPELADFLRVDRGATLCRRDVTNAICVYSRLKPDESRPHMLKWEYLNPQGKRNLQNPKERMAIVPDHALSKLLRYNKYKKDVKKGVVTKNVKDKKTRATTTVVVTEPTLYYWVIQKLLSVHYVTTLNNKAGAEDVEILSD